MPKKKTKNTLTYDSLSALFTGICDAIRGKTGESGLINHQDIPGIISDLPSGSDIIDCNYYTHAANTTFTKSYTLDPGEYMVEFCVTLGRDCSCKFNNTNIAKTHGPTSWSYWNGYSVIVTETGTLMLTEGSTGGTPGEVFILIKKLS